MSAHPQLPTLDGDRIRARRLELDLSERALTAKLGAAFSQSIVRSIEAGRAGRDLTLGDVAKVAEALGLPVSAILVSTAMAERDDKPDGQLPEGDDERMSFATKKTGALLRTVGGRLPAAAVAAAVGVGFEELDNILVRLNETLEPAGLGVTEVGGLLTLEPTHDDVPAAEVRTLARKQLAHDSMNITQALMLHRAVNGRLAKKAPTSGTAGNPEQVAKGSLLNAGILTTSRAGGLEPTDDVRFSLLLNE